MKNNIKHIFSYVQEDKKVYGRVIFFSIIIGLIEFLGVTSLMPVASLFLNGTVDNIPNFLKPFISNENISFVVITFIILVMIQTTLAIINEQYFVTNMAKWRTALSIKYVKNILNANFENFHLLKPGEIEVMITRNIGFAMKIRHRTAIFLSDNVLALCYLFIALYISIYSLFLFALLGIIYMLINKVTIKLRMLHAQISKDKYIIAAKHISEFFGDIRSLLSYKRENFLTKIENEIEDATIAQKSTDKINVFIKHIFQPVMILLIFLTIYISKNILAFDNSTILVMLYLFYRSAPKMIEVAKGYGEILGDSPSDVTPEVKKWELLNSNTSLNRKIPQKIDIKFNNKALKIKNNILIDKLDIQISANETIAFIGKSGSGKSTILDAVCGFLNLEEGSFTIDNISNESINYCDFLINDVALVRVEAKIISGTIIDNIAYLSDSKNRQKVQKYVDMLGLSAFLNERDGIDTVIDNRGEGLSAGQKQRIFLARALYKEPKLLILDEPTSNLDKKTEEDIVEVLNRQKGQMTILIASHSEDVIKICDKVYNIQNKNIDRIK
ncbi:ATP-binding cassette domain-containing protein [Halarcobacter ebronensis]|nr:ATP-binding cassette domain-containing protein [Halarcobacter ebronensis]